MGADVGRIMDRSGRLAAIGSSRRKFICAFFFGETRSVCDSDWILDARKKRNMLSISLCLKLNGGPVIFLFLNVASRLCLPSATARARRAYVHRCCCTSSGGVGLFHPAVLLCQFICQRHCQPARPSIMHLDPWPCRPHLHYLCHDGHHRHDINPHNKIYDNLHHRHHNGPNHLHHH
jgi:hypothetical protein